MYILRYMHLDDIPHVVEIDQLSFPLPWSARSYAFEVNDNISSHMIVLEIVEEGKNPLIIGYGGFWYIEGETHISTIAVHPDYRGKGLGEVLLAGMLARSIVLKAEYAVLEVRVSNTSALALYQKYEFAVVGRRRHYYRDNNEDAFQMHLSPMNETYQERFNQLFEKLNTRVSFVNNILHAPRNKPV